MIKFYFGLEWKLTQQRRWCGLSHKDLRKLQYFLSIEVGETKDGITLSQRDLEELRYFLGIEVVWFRILDGINLSQRDLEKLRYLLGIDVAQSIDSTSINLSQNVMWFDDVAFKFSRPC